MLAQTMFLNQLELVIKKKRTMEVVRDEGWYSEAEMKSELGWSPSGPEPAHAVLLINAGAQHGHTILSEC